MTLLIPFATIAVIGLGLNWLAKHRPWESRRTKFLRFFTKHQEQTIWESEGLRLFLREHEAPRLRNLIEFNTQRADQIEQRMKLSGKNDEAKKVKLKTIREQVEGYKEALRADVFLHNQQLNKEKMLRAKVDFLRRNLTTRVSRDDMSVVGLEATSSTQEDSVKDNE